ncbi:MAG: site-2 protease family protein [Gammaproteobacteria bacterium]|nr:site-2 protease family protein [Gammaproteobacteria bacterium]
MDVAAKVQFFAVAIIPILFGITLHEVSHGWTARYFGDRTAELLGRLSLNPIRHVDPVGTIAVPIVLYLLIGMPFGWAKPVPVNGRNLRDPKRNMVVVAAAGPVSNLAMALFWAMVFSTALGLLQPASVLRQFLLPMAQVGIYFNVLLCVFNLLPIPPLDGGRVLRGVVPEVLGRKLDAAEPYGLILVMALLALGFLGRVVGPVVDSVSRGILGLVGG